ncbi:MAG: ABC transporter substrate-binding protein [Leptolyngbyaceae cyanobacterium]
MAFFAVSACGRNLDRTNPPSPEQLTQDCRVVQHVMGETCIPQDLQRVVTLRPDHFANSFALGIEPVASVFAEGFPFPKDIQNEVSNVESVGDYSAPNLEKILQLKPDLIIANSRLEGIYEDLSRIAPTVVIDLPYPPPSWKKQLETLATFLGKEEASQQLIDNYRQRIENIKHALGPQLDQLEVSVANSSLEHGIWVLGEDHFVGEVLNDIGLQRPPSQRGDFFYIDNISKEKLSDIDGDVLFFVSMGREQDEEYQEELREDPLWQKLNTVQNDRVYFVDGYWQEAGSILAINAVLDDIKKYLVGGSLGTSN